MFLVNSRLGRFSAAHSHEHSFSRSYGVILQSSLAIVLSLTLGFSPHPCVSIFGTGPQSLRQELFLEAGFTFFCTCIAAFHPLHAFTLLRSFLPVTATSLAHALPSACPASLLRHSIHSSEEYRIFRLLSFDYAFRPRLSSRLSQSGRTFLWNPWVFGAMDSHHRSATHTGILSSSCSTCPSGHASSPLQRSPTTDPSVLSFGMMLSPGIFSAQVHSTSELLRTL